ncbi:hypothetical protein PanWU01x14_267800 [Parasponia andersonii]|uniref:Uncharacterized protein n=1 Tax=Parasponia andersonii TaxID=3476 RepID=A0A2P5B6I9_PARAD|nr:hypothetical protein PanWU01x14_267800 [Parasponia andersonii]
MQNFFLHILDIGSKCSRQIFLQNFLHENMVMFDKGRGKLFSVFTIELYTEVYYSIKEEKKPIKNKKVYNYIFLATRNCRTNA